MKLSGSVTLAAPPDKVWAAINDPVILAKSLPGCERLDPDGPNRFKAAVSFGLAAISGKYAGSLELAEKKPPHSMLLKMEGKGIPGFVKGEGRVELRAKGKQTELRYEGEAQVGGMIAAVGQRMIEAASKKIVAQFFEKFSSEIAGKS
ncbi:MAG TPA: carbon monoxide dehydrogenase subunit G [Candidatus Acidoferrales bacterium]|jgi:carbon monoxide dehydrogenase subunit G|nr:carbon monoxide dehydrogenase subunit G [Candidatus Acidoferrales bacterium]